MEDHICATVRSHSTRQSSIIGRYLARSLIHGPDKKIHEEDALNFKIPRQIRLRAVRYCQYVDIRDGEEQNGRLSTSFLERKVLRYELDINIAMYTHCFFRHPKTFLSMLREVDVWYLEKSNWKSVVVVKHIKRGVTILQTPFYEWNRHDLILMRRLEAHKIFRVRRRKPVSASLITMISSKDTTQMENDVVYRLTQAKWRKQGSTTSTSGSWTSETWLEVSLDLFTRFNGEELILLTERIIF